jgi:hypothetical protein
MSHKDCHLYSRKMPGILFISILIFNAHAYSTSIHQVDLTDADKKAILFILFEVELAASKNEELTIFLSPQTDNKWLLELPDIRFKQLSYEEENHVSEYYELRDTKIERDYIEVWLTKGNYCKKTGAEYQFRKEHGKWKAQIARTSESFTASGTTCLGCKTGSGSLYKLKLGTAQAALKELPKRKDLLLTGKALAIRCKRNDAKYIGCEVDLSLDFLNQGNQPIVILQPYGDYEFWQGARSLALTKADSETYNYVYSVVGWPSIYDTDKYRRLAQGLDQATPPANLTRVIASGESWKWKTTIQLGVAEENTCSGSVGVQIGWSEIKNLSAPIWLEVSYEMWPFNVENFKKDLGGQLRERWKKYGILYLEEKSERYWFAHLTSRPMELDFRQVQLQ